VFSSVAMLLSFSTEGWPRHALRHPASRTTTQMFPMYHCRHRHERS
jgi:hypothetical protein